MRRRIKRRKLKLFYRWGKLLLLLLVLGICVFGITMVNAGINDSKIEKNRIDGIYAVTNLNGRDRIFYLNMYTLNSIFLIFSVNNAINTKMIGIQHLSCFGS